MVSYEYSHSRDSSSRGVSRASYSAVFDNTQCEESLPFWQAKAAYSRDREYAAFNLVGCVFSSLGLRYPLRKPVYFPVFGRSPSSLVEGTHTGQKGTCVRGEG